MCLFSIDLLDLMAMIKLMSQKRLNGQVRKPLSNKPNDLNPD